MNYSYPLRSQRQNYRDGPLCSSTYIQRTERVVIMNIPAQRSSFLASISAGKVFHLVG